MEVPQDIQEKLKCSDCGKLLSCGPIYLLHETAGAICGRCSQQHNEPDSTENRVRIRNGPYEATASMLVFPCTFAAQGCSEKVKFSIGQPLHELSCKFRPLICPIVPRGSCNWVGLRPTLKEHCNKIHKSNLLKNKNYFPVPDLTISNVQSYLISALNFFFLLQIKVCVTSGNLFHSLRMFGDPKFLDMFSFTLEVEGINTKFSTSGSVFHAGILPIQEPTAICPTVNNLLKILGNKCDASKFAIRIKTSLNFNCINCFKNVNFESNSLFCGECKRFLVKCESNENGCLFMDVNIDKCRKHELYFCEYQKKCWYCDVNFEYDGSFIEHMFSPTRCCETIKSNISSVVRVTLTPKTKSTYILFSSNDIGTVVCENYLSSCKLHQYLYTSIPSQELKNFKCSIELTDPITKHTQLIVPQIIVYNDCYDWSIHETMETFPSIFQNIGIDIKLVIEKI